MLKLQRGINMPRDHFIFRKNNQLKKIDKSLKGHIDKRIEKLCDSINKTNNYYTTSSCSGRIVLLKARKEKTGDLFIRTWHDEVSFKDFKLELEKINSKELIYFKQEPCIIHVACRKLEDAQKLINLAMKAGWKRNGIIASDKRFVAELNSTEKLEFPIFKNKILFDEIYLKLIVSEANKKLNESWEKIERIERELINTKSS